MYRKYSQQILKKTLKVINNIEMESHNVIKSEKNNNIRNDPKYKIIIRKIANKLKKRIKFPKCKIFKFYMTYRILILRIANEIKKSKKANFFEKKENNKIGKDINQIKEIDSISPKIKKEEGKQKIIRKIIYFSGRKKNIQINLSLFRKNEKIKKTNLDINNNNNSEINNQILYLKNLNIKSNNITNFINDFSSFLEKNNIQICPESKLPKFRNNNNIYLLNKEEFWIKYIIFISNKYKNNLTINIFTNFIQIFYIWNDTNINDNFNNEIKNQINNLFSKETINNFFLCYNIKNLDELFEKYKFIYGNANMYKEIKIGDNDCNCPICKNKVFIDKIINYKKRYNKLSLFKINSISFTINKTDKKNLNKKINNNNDREIEGFLKYLRKDNKKPND